MKIGAAIIATLTLVVLAGCATAPMATPENDQKAKLFVPQTDKAALYIFRNEIFGGAISMDVSVNGKGIGHTAARSYFQLDLLPGRYSIDSHAENDSNLTLSLDAGQNYFVWQEVKMGVWMARSRLQQVDDATGKKGVMESKLISPIVNGNEIAPLEASSPPAKVIVGDLTKKLKDLQKLKDDGLITGEDYERKRRQLIEKF